MIFPSSQDDQAEAVAAGLDALARVKPPTLHHFKLDNGLSVYLHEDHSAPLAAVQLWYHIGTSDEPPGHSNLSHLLEHLIFKGSFKLPAGHYSKIIARLGGVSNATTYDDATAFEITLPATRLPVALEIMADAMTGATLDQGVFEQEVKAVEDERRLKVDNSPFQLAYEQHRKLAHGDAVYGEPTFGHAIDLREMTLASVRTWYRTWYQPNNASLVVVGAIDPQRLRQAVDACFAPLPPAPLRDKPVSRQTGTLQERSHTLVRPGLEDGLIMSFNVPSQATAPSPETALALRLLSEVLGSGFSALLYSRLTRDKRILMFPELTYDHHLRGDSLLTLSALVNQKLATPETAADEVWAVIDELRNTPLPAQALERAKLRLLARLLYAHDDLAQQAALIGHAAAAGLDPAQTEAQPRLVRGISSATLQQVAAHYLCRERLTITYMKQGTSA